MKSNQNPYWPFFLVGWVMALAFFALWPVFVFAKRGFNPLLLHQHGVVSLVIGSFAIGFLLTALPRFTGTTAASNRDVATLMLISAAEFAFLLSSHTAWAYFLGAGKFVYLAIFTSRCFRQAAQGQPPNTLWILLALLAMIAGQMMLGLFHLLANGTISPLFADWGKALASRGFLTAIFIGIGSRLMPMLMGISTAGPEKNLIFHPLHPWLALLFFTGLMLEPWHLRLASAMQAVAIATEVIYLWRAWQLPNRGSRAVGLWLVVWSFVLTAVAVVLWPQWRVDLYHVAFIGVFLAATVAVASHVLVRHGNNNELLLNQFWPLGMVLLLLGLAMLTRVSAVWVSYWQHLGYAGATIVVAFALWGIIFFKNRSTS